jgi:hypothetical protein
VFTLAIVAEDIADVAKIYKDVKYSLGNNETE